MEKRYLQALGLLSGLFAALFGVRVVLTGTFHFWYLLWNLGLAWISLVIIWILTNRLKKSRWAKLAERQFKCIMANFLTEYLVCFDRLCTCFYKRRNQPAVDIVLMGVLTICGFILGFTSLYLMHKQTS